MAIAPKLMNIFFLLVGALFFAATGFANLQRFPVTPANLEELELDFSLSFEPLTADLILVRLTARKEGKLKNMTGPSVFLPSRKGTLLDVPLAPEAVLADQYSFTLDRGEISRARLHLHCWPGGSSEIRYEIDLYEYGLKAGVQRDPDLYDYLPLLTGERRDVARAGALRELNNAEVPSIEAARDAAMQQKVNHGGLDARDGSRVVALFPLSHDVAEFGAEGDLIWDVRILRFGEQVSDQIWINSRNGKVKAMLAAGPPAIAGPEPEPGPEDAGLRLRLAIAPHPDAATEGYDVRLDLLNVSADDTVLTAEWLHESDHGDLKDYIEASTSIESYPEVAPWVGGVELEPRVSPQPEYVLKADEVLSIRWQTQGRKLKNSVSDPNRVQNPTFPFPGQYAIHATLKINANGRTAFLRSNEQLIAVGGSGQLSKHTYGTCDLLGFIIGGAEVADPLLGRREGAFLQLGALHKIEPGDEFRITASKVDFWKLIITRVFPEHSIGRLEPLPRVGSNPTNPNPRLPDQRTSATLILENDG